MSTVKSEARVAGNGLPPGLRELARQELGETDVGKREALKKLRELIEGEPSLPCGTDEAFLTVFLRARKYDTLRAFKTVKGVYQSQINNPEMFEDLGVHSIPFDVVCRKNQLFTLSQGTDPQGRPAGMLKIGKWNADICSVDDMFRVGTLLILHLLRKEESQIRGIVFVIDVMGFGSHHLMHITPSVLRKLISLVQECCPLRIKGVYVVNHPAIFDVLYTVAKLFLKPKLKKRIHLFGYDVSKLQGLVPDDLIPKEYGGTHESYDYDEMERQLKNNAKWFREFLRASQGDRAGRRGSHFNAL